LKNPLRSMKRSTGLAVAVLGVSALALTACGSAPEEGGNGSSAAPQATDFTGCIVSDSGGFDDRSFNQSSYEGLQQAEEDYGIEVKRAESQSATDFTANVDSMVQQGCDLTVTVGFLLSDTTKAAAEANPESNFAIVDDNAIDLPNVKPITYDTAQAAFLAGYVAAGSTETGTVATYGGMQIPTVTIFMDGFADGVEYYNEQKGTDVKLLGWDKDSQNGTFVGNFEDQGKGKTNTLNFINEGADIIMPVAGPVGLGTLDAVIESNAGGKNARVVWVDSDGYESAGKAEEFILTSVLKEMGTSVHDVTKSAIDGAFDATPYVGTLENGGVGIAPFHEQDANVPAELKTEVEQLKQDIIDGKVTVESEASPK
jgi:basic membrane lipoprotein Med (substrate-binding protein (PBP1-ABC) superfamily)